MRNLMTMTALATLAMATPAMAQVTGTVDIDGSVADRCLFTTDNAVISVGELALAGSGSTAGRRSATARAVSAARTSGECQTAVRGTPERRSARSSACRRPRGESGPSASPCSASRCSPCRTRYR